MAHLKKLLVCPRCHQWFSCNASDRPHHCDSCPVMLVETDTDYAAYSKMTDSQKLAYKQDYLNTHTLTEVLKAQDAASSDDGDNAWILCLRVTGWATLIGVVLASLYFNPSAETGDGLFVIILSVVAGLLACSGIMVFAGIAKDIKTIKQHLTQKQ